MLCGVRQRCGFVQNSTKIFKKGCCKVNFVKYDKQLHGDLNYPDGFCDLLKGLSLEEQMKYFRIANGLYLKKKFQDRRKNKYDYSCQLQDYEDVEAIIVRNGLIVAVLVKNCYEQIVPCLPEKGFITYDECEIDGSGYKECKLYLYLVCVGDDFDNIS